MKISFIILASFSVCFVSCSKSSGPSSPPGVDVYAVGQILASNNVYVAAIWKNGVLTKLSDSNMDYYAIAIATQGTDIYVAGYSYNNGASTAMYWKNGRATTLGAGQALSIAVDNQDVYLAGVDGSQTKAVFWKNGVQNALAGQYPSTAQAIAVSGAHVYTGGTTWNTSVNRPEATEWDNSMPGLLSNNPADSAALGVASVVTGITLSGGNVYFSGYIVAGSASNQYTMAAYWKNGIPTKLKDNPGNTAGSFGNGLAVNGNDVYVAGDMGGVYQNNIVASYWKNGVAIPLTDDSQYSSDSYAIQVYGNDIYVSGYTNSNTQALIATYWKNGNAVMLSNISSCAFGIAILPHQ